MNIKIVCPKYYGGHYIVNQDSVLSGTVCYGHLVYKSYNSLPFGDNVKFDVLLNGRDWQQWTGKLLPSGDCIAANACYSFLILL